MASLTHTFFGEDQGLGEATRAPHPNADAARNAFLAVLIGNGNGLESFESIADDTITPLTLPSFTGLGTVQITETGLGFGFVNEIPSGTNGAGRYPITGNKYFDFRAGNVVSFTNPALAIGFYTTDVGDFGAVMALRIHTVSAGVVDVTIPNIFTTGGGVLYFGCICSDEFTSVEFINQSGGFDIFGMDDLIIADAAHVTAAGQLLVGITPAAPVSLADPGPFIPDFDPCTSRPPRRGERWEVCSRCGFCYPQSEVVVQQGTGGGVIVCVRFCLDEPSRRDLRPDELTVEAPLSFVDDEGPMV